MKPTVLILVSRGSGMTEGLEMWYNKKLRKFILVDVSPDRRFEVDVAVWSTGKITLK